MFLEDIFPYIALLLFLGIIGAYGYTTINNHYWNNGKIPPFFGFSEMNQMEICVAFAGFFARFDRQVYGDKFELLQRFTRKNFPSQHYDYRSSFNQSLRNPTDIREIGLWLVKNKAKKSFMLDLGSLGFQLVVADGFLTSLEDKHLSQFFYTINEEAFYKKLKNDYFQNQRKREKRTTTSNLRPQKNRLYYTKILGVSENCGETEIKNAFRKLAKKYHPDKQKTENDKKESARLFQEIVEAKDWLLAN